MTKNSSLKWLYLDFNSYFTTIEQQINASMRYKPIAVVPSLTDYTCAIAASYEAKKLGIKTGTMIFQAKKLCPQLICVEANHEKYIYYHHRLIREINKYIPIDSVCSIDEVACKLLGKETEVKEALSIALSIKAGIKKNVGDYISCSIGISTNKFLAKTASNLKKPDGLKILFRKDVPRRIKYFKLTDLTGIGKRIEHRLILSGVHSIESLYNLSPKNMRKIWSSVQGERFWYMIRGNDIKDDIINNTNTIGHSHVLHPNWRTLEKSNLVLKRLILKAASRLRRKNYFCKKLKISLKSQCGKKFEKNKKFSRTSDSLTLLEEVDFIWKNILKTHKIKTVKKISVILYDLEFTDSPQMNFLESFDHKFQDSLKKRKKLSRTMDKINTRFGKDSITIGSISKKISRFSGTKIAFTRIPDISEFYE